MSTIVQSLVKFLIVVCLAFGALLILKNRGEIYNQKKPQLLENSNPKASVLKKYLATYKKPARIEFFNYTQKYNQDVNQILELKIATDPNSNFYITIQFFTDETDYAAPLVAQIRFLDVKTNNITKEQSINLE